MRNAALVLTAAALFAPTVSLAQGPAAELKVGFTDPVWTGGEVAPAQRCKKFGGAGSSPALQVSGAPAATAAFKVLFNDETLKMMDNGGHGVVRYAVKPTAGAATLPSLPGETDALPAGVITVAKHKAERFSGTGGAYLPPCSGGRGNTYSVVVEALGPDDAVLARGRAVMGTF